MANRSGLVAFVRAVRARVLADGLTTTVSIGWRARDLQLNQGAGCANRIVFIPGDGGTLGKSTRGNWNPAPLASDEMKVVMSVWAADPDDTYDEEKQIEATEALRELAMRACHLAVDTDTNQALGVANLIWGTWKWSAENREMNFGREMLINLTLQTQIFRAAYDTGTPAGVIHRGTLT